MPYARRREALRTRLRDRDIGALLITRPVNVRYLTGFTGSHAALLVYAADHPDREDRTVLCTDGRYEHQSAQEVPDLRRVIERSSALTLARQAVDSGMTRLGFESHVVTVDGQAELAEVAGSRRLVTVSRAVEDLRAVKEPGELAALRTACAAADAALAGMLTDGGLRPGRTERDVARDLEARMVAAGAQGPAFETIVAAGPHSAMPHHRPTEAELRIGDLVTMDFGALVDGYHSDMTRTVALGEPAVWQRELHELVARAQAAGRSALRTGVPASDADAAARAVIADAGYGDEFVHSLGHGVGLDVHEAPALSAASAAILDEGMTVTVEPGVYLATRGGVRTEDILAVTGGEPELLTAAATNLVVA